MAATPKRSFRMGDDQWGAFKAACGQDGMQAVEVLTRLIHLYVNGKITADELRVSTPDAEGRGVTLAEIDAKLDRLLSGQS